MMSPEEIRMCVVDVLQDDDIENVDSILRMLNFPDEPSWRASRGAAFTDAEVREALRILIADGLVTPCAEYPRSGECSSIPADHVGVRYPWDSLWFHLEPAGRDAVHHWWKTEGQVKYPNPD